MPQRIQLRRVEGWRKPEQAIVVARPSKWGNPFLIGENSPWAPYKPMDAPQAVAVYRYAWDTPEGRMRARELAGRDLACWCLLDQPCHADVLLELANAPSLGMSHLATAGERERVPPLAGGASETAAGADAPPSISPAAHERNLQ